MSLTHTMYNKCWLGWKHDKPGEGAGERAKRGGGAAQGAAGSSQRGDPLQPGRRPPGDRCGQGPRHPLTAGEPLGVDKSFSISLGPSVADQGCLSWIRLFSIPDLSSRKYDTGCSSRIRMLAFYRSRLSTDPRSRGQKGIGSRIRIRNTAWTDIFFSFSDLRILLF